MGKIPIFHTTFSGGELGEIVLGRSDMAKYRAGLRQGLNWILLPQGGAMTRPGMRYVAAAAGETALIPFIYGTGTAYLLEFSNLLIRIRSAGGTLLASVVSPYLTAELAEIAYAQSADVIYLVHQNHQPMKLIRTKADGTEWKLNLLKPSPPTTQPENVDLGGSIWFGESTGLGIQVISDVDLFLASDVDRQILYGSGRAIIKTVSGPRSITVDVVEDFVASLAVVQASTVSAGTGHYEDGAGDVTSGAAPNDDELTFSVDPNLNVNDIISPKGTPNESEQRTIVAVDVGADPLRCDIDSPFTDALVNALWEKWVGTPDPPTRLTFSDAPGLGVGDKISLSGTANQGEVRTVTAINAGGDPLKVDIDTAFTDVPAAAAWQLCAEVPSGDEGWRLTGTPACRIRADKINPVGASVTVTLYDNAGGAPIDGWRTSDVGKFVKMSGGIIKLTSRTSASVMVGELLQEIAWSAVLPAEILSGAWTLEVELWRAGNYPAAVCLYDQRLGFGGVPSLPQTFIFSRTGDYENFGVGATDDAAFEFMLSSNQVNSIQWMVSAKILFIGTLGAEFRVSGTSEGPITPTNVDARSETTHGTSKVLPERIGHTTLFVQKGGKRLREIVYEFNRDTFTAPDLTKMNPDITGNGIVRMAYQQEPYSILWCVRADGALLAFTYDNIEEVAGWTRIITGDRGGGDIDVVESVAVIPAADGLTDRVWLVVKRKVAGAWVRYIEYLDFTLSTDSASNDKAALAHLNGNSVAIVADGAVKAQQVVAGGAVTVSGTAIEAGLPFSCILEPVPFDLLAGSGTPVQGYIRGIFDVRARLLNTRGITISGEPLRLPESEVLMDTAPSYFSGDYPVNLLGQDFNQTVIIRQDQPLKATVLALYGKMQVGS